MFLLPIYRYTKEELDNWVQQKADAEINNVQELSGTMSEMLRLQTIDSKQEEYGTSWPFNRAVGWVNVNKTQNGFMFVLAKSSNGNNRSPKKYFHLISPDKVEYGWHEVDFTDCKNGIAAIEKFKTVLSVFTKEGIFKKCHIDISSIEEIANFINWKEIFSGKL